MWPFAARLTLQSAAHLRQLALGSNIYCSHAPKVLYSVQKQANHGLFYELSGCFYYYSRLFFILIIGGLAEIIVSSSHPRYTQ